MRRHSTLFVALTLLVKALLVAGCASRPAAADRAPQPTPSADPAPSAPTPPLKALQASFRPTYDAARDAVDASLTPLVVVRLSDMFLVRDGAVIAEAKGIPQKYHLLHRTAHVPFVIYLTIHPCFGQALPESVANKLAEYRRLLDPAITDLPNYSFTERELADQEFVLRRSAEYLDTLHAGAAVDHRAFASFRSRIAEPMMALADAAGAAQVDATHAVMTQWKAMLTAEEWQRLRVIIIGFRQPRHDYAATQYFAALFPARANSLFPGESDRVFYVEAGSIDRNDRLFKDARKAVAALLLDGDAATAMFNNPYRMSIDVMADGARRRIAELDFSSLHTARSVGPHAAPYIPIGSR